MRGYGRQGKGGRGFGGGIGDRRVGDSSESQVRPDYSSQQQGGYVRGGRGLPHRGYGDRGRGASGVGDSSESQGGIGDRVVGDSSESRPKGKGQMSGETGIQKQYSASSEEAMPASSMSFQFPSRPKEGEAGTKCLVKANHFLLELQDKDLHQYEVKFTPANTSTSHWVKRAVINQLVESYRSSYLGNRLPAYDGINTMYTAGALPFQSKDFKITLPMMGEEGVGGSRREGEFEVLIKFVTRVDVNSLVLFYRRQADEPREVIKALDIVLRQYPTKVYKPMGRSFFPRQVGIKHKLGEQLESWTGFYPRILPTQMGLSLNIHTSSHVFVQPLSVIDFVTNLLGRDISDGPLSSNDCVKITEALGGVKMEVTHRGKERRKYRIIGLTEQTTSDITFRVGKTDVMISITEYFQQAYKVDIGYTDLPCLKVGNPGKPIYFPMKVCKIVEGQRYPERLNGGVLSDFQHVSRPNPAVRESGILEIAQLNNREGDEDFWAEEFGIKIHKDMAVVDARVLPAPKLKYNDSGENKFAFPENGQWNMNKKRMINGGKVQTWACISFCRYVVKSREFCRNLAKMCTALGMTFNAEPVLPFIERAGPNEVERVLRTKLEPLAKRLDLLVVILPRNNGSLYGDVKRICETDLGILSQCCLDNRVQKMDKPYLASVALKINVKVGGRNMVLADALTRSIPFITDIPTIIFGADVTHSGPGDISSPSIAAVVASQDWPQITKYAGRVCAQKGELIKGLFVDPVKEKTSDGGMIKELLVSFYRETGFKPQRIIFYRDGVSEGQFKTVLRYEVDAIQKACASLGYNPKVTFVVVQKRHHTRFFAHDLNDKKFVDRNGNILPGTVVDTAICHPTNFDFFLCSHVGMQGTSRPARYCVLWDENEFTADGLQKLTNDLCYTYARCTKVVSIVAPVYYAHLAAFRARFYLEPETRETAANARVRSLRQPKENVKSVMFFC